MQSISIYSIIPLVLLALGTMTVTSKAFAITCPKVKYPTIDGLRGYLAFFVFLHHSLVWYFYLKTQRWELPPSNLYIHFGQTSVSLFFMITSFLFFLKLQSARFRPIDWLKLYISRILRIYPLYLVALFVVILIVAILSGFQLHDSSKSLLTSLTQWLAFIGPDINRVQNTRQIMAGVTWSLPFEWFFYALLPILGLLLYNSKTSALTLLSSFIMTAFFLFILTRYHRGNLPASLSFLGGIGGAVLVKKEKVRTIASSKIASVFILLCLFLLIYFFKTAYHPVALLLISVIFVGIACGNSMFGILTNSISRKLGQISYSIYLLHGIVLFITFRFITGFAGIAKMSPIEYWGVIGGCDIGVITICSITFKFIEMPSLKAVDRITGAIRQTSRIRRFGIRSDRVA